jgi:hypothetical protein
MIADGREPGSRDEMVRALDKVYGYIGIALEEASDGRPSTALDVLKANHMEFLFRRGFSIIMDLRREAERLVRDCEGGADNLGYPLAELVKGLLLRRPLFSAGVAGESRPRDFRSMEDIRLIRRMIDRDRIDDQWVPI